MTQHDSLPASLLWGRIGGSVLVLAGVVLSYCGIEFGAEDQEQAYNGVALILSTVGGLMALVSKLRERHRDQLGEKGNTLRRQGGEWL